MSRQASLLAILAACGSPAPRPLAYDTETCSQCHMTLADRRFGAELVLATGRVIPFDDTGCLITFLTSDSTTAAGVHSIHVTDFLPPHALLDATSAMFLVSDSIRTPMDYHIAALSRQSADSVRAAMGGELVTWDKARALIQSRSSGEPRLLLAPATTGATIIVEPAGPIRTVTDALAIARPLDRIVVKSGIYREPAIVVRIPVELVGEGNPVLQGGAHHTLEIRADGVVIRGITFVGVEPSMTEDRAAILVNGASDCRIEDNVMREAFFGIYLKGVTRCTVQRNRLTTSGKPDAPRGNGIHLWRSREVTIQSNLVDGHRDGVYFEFVSATVVRDNTVTASQRYGLHFMRSDSCSYERNTFVRNGAGAAVMYSRWVTVVDNTFERNWGSAAYGLLLKEISDGVIRDNRFIENTVALYLDGSNRNLITGNQFDNNGWAIRLLASASDNRFERNSFRANAFDVATNSRTTNSTFRENWWDRYRGYDLNRDGRGDVPFRPVRLFGLVVEQNNPSLLLLRSPLVDLLDTAERLLPMLTPETLVDSLPMMWRRSR